MSANRRKFLIGGAGLSASLAVPYIAGATSPIDPLSDEFSRYFAFLAHEHKQAWIEISRAKLVQRFGQSEAHRIAIQQVEHGSWPMEWMPGEYVDISKKCLGARERPTDRARAVMCAAGFK